MAGLISRREFCQVSVLSAAGLVLAACGGGDPKDIPVYAGLQTITDTTWQWFNTIVEVPLSQPVVEELSLDDFFAKYKEKLKSRGYPDDTVNATDLTETPSVSSSDGKFIYLNRGATIWEGLNGLLPDTEIKEEKNHLSAFLILGEYCNLLANYQEIDPIDPFGMGKVSIDGVAGLSLFGNLVEEQKRVGYRGFQRGLRYLIAKDIFKDLGLPDQRMYAKDHYLSEIVRLIRDGFGLKNEKLIEWISKNDPLEFIDFLKSKIIEIEETDNENDEQVKKAEKRALSLFFLPSTYEISQWYAINDVELALNAFLPIRPSIRMPGMYLQDVPNLPDPPTNDGLARTLDLDNGTIGYMFPRLAAPTRGRVTVGTIFSRVLEEIRRELRV